ncbi:glycosyltransferase family protein [Paenibacillus sp. FSL H3-0333]|uniref:glycosyltransferase family protein n=1 Tax=Paenibacillus sp. FSL H3-0333 TaxID=2921373 RepID=UPI0030F8119C
MKKILLGICGIGYGHVNRQKLIINHLVEYDIDLVLAVTKKNYELFDGLYPSIKKVIVNRPWIVCDNRGIDFTATKIKYSEFGFDQFDGFLDFSIEVEKAFNGEHPDFVLSDYEPYSAQFAYATNKPLICLDQQAKFLNLPTKKVNNFTIEDATGLLHYFFPKANKRYASSFFTIRSSGKYNIEAIPPVLKDIKRGLVDNSKVVVYFSPYTSNSDKYIKILELIKHYKNYEFHIYSELDFLNYHKYNNFHFKKIGEEFDSDLTDCKFIISSSGHQLISEAINLEIPLYIFPLDTFDQNYCCYIVEKQKFGKRIKTNDQKEFDLFIESLEKYITNMQNYKRTNWKSKWNEVLFEKLEKELNIMKKKIT